MRKALWLFGTELSIIIDETKTDGRFDMILGNFAPGVETPLHLHTKYSETLYVLEGEFTVHTKKGTTVLRPGDDIFIPIGMPHAIASTGNTMSKGLTVASPSGFAKLIRSTGIEEEPSGMPVEIKNDMNLFLKISEETGDIILGPPGTRP